MIARGSLLRSLVEERSTAERPGEIDAVLRPELHPLREAIPHGIDWVIDGTPIPVTYCSRAEIVLLAA